MQFILVRNPIYLRESLNNLWYDRGYERQVKGQGKSAQLDDVEIALELNGGGFYKLLVDYAILCRP